MRVLLIMPSFFNYPDVIVKSLNDMGIECDWYNDRPSDNPFVKAAIRLHEDSLEFLVDRMVDRIIEQCNQNQYDRVLIISGQSLSLNESHILSLKSYNLNAEFVLYQWDSLANYPRILKLLDLFDRTYSFDKEDCIKYGLSFLPLFYHDGYGRIRKDLNQPNFDYELSFIGTAHPKKHNFLKSIIDGGQFDIDKCFLFEYLPSRLVYIRHRVLEESYRNDKMSAFQYHPLTPRETESVVSRSRIVLDSPQSNQGGLTIRTIECLGAGRKLITTNSNVVDYDFYCDRNIYVYQGEFDFSHPFFTSSYKQVDDEIVESYSLESWLSVVLGI